MLFVQFLNIGEVLKDVRQLSYMTSLWISLLVLGFVVMGTIFAYIVSQQLHNVSKQIKMLKSLKFAEVVDKNKGVKGKSFIAELHELQQSFLEMVVVLAGAFKRNQSFAKGGGFATGGGRKMSASGQRNNDPPRSSVAMPPPTQNIFGPGPAGFSKENEHRSSKTRQSMQEGPVDDAIEARFMPRTQSLTAPPVNLLANFANMVASRKGSVEF
ncbi:hypothetical protein BC830DRAFT_1145314 [Chytriomyces sp. MP71]|nr:hypothetical protein BC830DRAFT_1145314 [Chytriomyces sp. MP71]